MNIRFKLLNTSVVKSPIVGLCLTGDGQLSFWIKSSVAGRMSGSFADQIFGFDCYKPDTWEFKNIQLQTMDDEVRADD